MKKLAFFQHDLDIGGIQKGLVNLLNSLDPERFEADLYLFSEGGHWENRIPDSVSVHHLQPFPQVSKYMPFDLALSRYGYTFEPMEHEFDAAIDYNSYQPWTAAAAITIPSRRRVLMVHNDIERKYQEEWKYRVLFHFMKGKYKYFDAFAMVSDPLVEPFIRMTGVSDKTFFTMPNCIDTAEIRTAAKEEDKSFHPDPGKINLCAVGRLCHQKGYDRMLEVFDQAAKNRDDLRLYIVGEGPERKHIEQDIRKRGLSGKVFLLGAKANPFPVMNQCDGLISTSYYEGQGMNLYEAKALGLQVIVPEHLTKYAPEINGSVDPVTTLCGMKKQDKQPDSLDEYNRKVLAMLDQL